MRQAASTRTGSSARSSTGRSLSLYQSPPKYPPPTILPLPPSAPPATATVARPTSTGPTPTAARSGDHLEIHRFLRNVFHGPSAAEFNAQLDAPDYQPAQRLILSCGREIVGHVRMAPTAVRYGAATIPVCNLADLAVSLPLRRRGLASALVAEAETRARESGAVLACVRTTAIEFFSRRGWAIAGRHSYSVIDPCRLIAAIAEREAGVAGSGTLLKPKMPRVWRVRPFLRYDLPAVMRLVREAGERFGAPERDQARWEWLLERKAFESIYVVVDAQQPDEVVGYLVAAEGRIGELVVDPQATGAAERLLAHFCRDAVEQSIPDVRYDGPPNDPWHAFAVQAGGKHYHEPVCGGEAYFVKALEPLKLLELTAPAWKQRGGELTLECSEAKAKQTYHLDGRTGRVTSPASAGGCRLQLATSQLAPLVLGGLSSRALDLAAKNRRAAEAAVAFFPPRPWYTPSWEQWTAR